MTFIIAEGGLNWNNLREAKELATKASECGADAIKYQTAWNWEYPELTKTEWKELKKYCDELSIEFMSTAWSFEAIDFLNELGITRWKIPSSESCNRKYIDYINRVSPFIAYISHGFGESSYYEFGMGTKTYHLYCVSKYPTEIKDLKYLKNPLHYDGYSDHSRGIIAPIVAATKGAKVIEKHLCLNRDCIDSKVSVMPYQFREMVEWIRHLEVESPDPKIPYSTLKLRNRVK